MSFLYILAVACSLIVSYFHLSILQQLGVLLTEIFTKMFQCVSLPVIALSMIVTIAQPNPLQDKTKYISHWKRLLIYTIATTMIAATISAILYLIIKPSHLAMIDEKNNMQPSIPAIGYKAYLMDLIPSNLLKPFVENNVMAGLLISLFIGVAIRYIPDEKPRNVVIDFFKGIHAVFLNITSWIMKIIPLALFGFITSMIMQLRNGIDLSGLTQYLLVIVLANLIQGLIILPLFLYMNKIKPWKLMKTIFPALSLAFFSKSSTGTLPATIKIMERDLEVDPSISRFCLPLCTSVNMNGCAAFIFTTVIYVMQNSHIEITPLTMLTWIGIGTLAAIGNAGVPMGCFFLSASLLTSMHVPITLLGLILPFYNMIDMLETALNVWSDVCVVTVINDKTKRLVG